jgi:hypothetical protein
MVDANPFPVLYDRDFKGIETDTPKMFRNIQLQEYLDPLLGSLRQHFGSDLIVYSNKEGHEEATFLFTLNHIRKDKNRHQPVVGEFYISEEGLYFMKKPVFCFLIM